MDAEGGDPRERKPAAVNPSESVFRAGAPDSSAWRAEPHDASKFEANAAAYVLEKLLVQHTFESVDSIPRALARGQEMPAGVAEALVVFTTGCFSKKEYVMRLAAASECHLEMFAKVSGLWSCRKAESNTVADIGGRG